MARPLRVEYYGAFYVELNIKNVSEVLYYFLISFGRE